MSPVSVFPQPTSWEEFKTTVAQPLRLRVIEPAGSDYAIVRYVKEKSDMTNPLTQMFRSVVWNKVTNRPVCVAPFKAQPDSTVSGTVQISDFVDGTMINAWRDASGIHIATRTSLNATGTFYSDRTFAELFDEVCKPMRGRHTFLSSLQEGDFVSMVLQHKEHKTVAPIPYNRIFVVAVGSVEEGNVVSMNFQPTQWDGRFAVFASYAPQVYETLQMSSKEDALAYMRNQPGSRYHTWQGIVLQSVDSSNRWRFRNPQYVVVRSLRGSEANPMARFLRLRNSGQTKQYLSYFREESNQMWAFEQTLRTRTQELYDAYVAMNKLKTKTMRDLPYCLRPHVYALHGKYLAAVKTASENHEGITHKAEPITKQKVIEYVNDLAEEEQLKLLEGDRAPLPPTAPTC